MKVLLDECVPKRLVGQLAGHEVMTVPQAGWATIKNGKLLRLAETQFDVFITVDRNLSYQQDTARLKLGVIVLHARSNRVRDLLPLVPDILKAPLRIQPGEVIVIGHSALPPRTAPAPTPPS